MSYVAKRADPEQKTFPWKPLIVMLALAVIAVSAFLIWHFTVGRAADPFEADPNVQIGTINMSEEERLAALQEAVDEGTLSAAINATPMVSLSDPEQWVNWLLENRPDNRNRFNLKVVRSDNGQVIYESGYLEPDQFIEAAPLDVKQTETGEFPCLATYYLYSLDDGHYISKSNALLTLYVVE